MDDRELTSAEPTTGIRVEIVGDLSKLPRMSEEQKREWEHGLPLYESLSPAEQARWAKRTPGELLAHYASVRMPAARPRESRPRESRPRARRARSRSPGSSSADPDEPEPPRGRLLRRVTDSSRVTVSRSPSPRPCKECGEAFTPRRRSNACFCGAACKQRSARRRWKAERERRAEEEASPPPPPLTAAEEAALMRRAGGALWLLGEMCKEERKTEAPLLLYEVVRPGEPGAGARTSLLRRAVEREAPEAEEAAA